MASSISLQDAIALALENNLDLASFATTLPIAQPILQRTKAGGVVNGVNVSVVSGTQAAALADPGRRWGRRPRVSSGGAGGLVTPRSAPVPPYPPFDPSLFFAAMCDHTTHAARTCSLPVSASQAEHHRSPNRITRSIFPWAPTCRCTTPACGRPQQLLQPSIPLQSRISTTVNQPLLARLRTCHEQALHPHRQEEPAAHRSRLQAQVIATITQVEASTGIWSTPIRTSRSRSGRCSSPIRR